MNGSFEPSSTNAALCMNGSYRYLAMLSGEAVKRRALMMILQLSAETPATALLFRRRL